jgi:uncharacterized protein (DUF2235 family)
VHVIIIDGTLSSLAPDRIANAGLTYQLMQEMGSAVSVHYQPGLQLRHWRDFWKILTGRGINRQIRLAYSWLASRYRPGDRIFFFGYSRGAYAVRSLAGIIDRVGLLRADAATERNVRDAYRYYQHSPDSAAAVTFRHLHCHKHVPIEMVGVWDTVKSLGLNAPVLWRLSVPGHAFHNHGLGEAVRRGRHALAYHETRQAFAPILWDTHDRPDSDVRQMWFRGAHGDIGGQLGGFEAARPLSHIPLVWMLEQAEETGLPLPQGWNDRFPKDAFAPAKGTFRGFGRWLLTRRTRRVGSDPSEHLHPTLKDREAGPKDRDVAPMETT